jgi:hypothetical protein
MVAPAAHQGGTARRTLGRGPPRSRARRPLERGPPRSKAPTRACSHLRVRALNALTPQGRAITLTRLGITPQRCSTNSLGGTHPATVERCATRPVSARDTVPPTPVRLTRRALEGGRRNPRMLLP